MEVLVIGAGAAGLAATARLRRAGLDVQVLEARARSGGRILTLREPSFPAPVELGAEFVHGDAPLTRRLLDDVGEACEPVDAEAWERRGGGLTPSATWERVDRVLSGLDDLDGPEASFAEFLRARSDLHAGDASAALAFVEGFFAADAERIGTRAIAREGGADAATRSSRVPGGYDTLVRRLEDGAAIDLDHAVQRVEWLPGRVLARGVRTRSGTPFAPREARALVLTVPLGVLTAPTSNGPLLSPTAPRIVEAWGRLAMGRAVRLVVVFRRPISEVLGFRGFLHAPERAPHVFWTLEPTSDRVLVAWSGGPRAERLPQRGGALWNETLDVLTQATGVGRRDIEQNVMAVRWHDWSADPWSRGAYAYPRVGGADAAEALSEPEAGTVFLAGEATSPDGMGTVEGALASGVRAAEQVIDALGRTGV